MADHSKTHHELTEEIAALKERIQSLEAAQSLGTDAQCPSGSPLELFRNDEEYLRAILRATGDYFLVIDMEGNVTNVNEGYCRMSGYTQDELLSMSISDFEALEKRSETVEHLRHILAKRSEVFETRHRRKDGTVWDVEVSVSYLGRNGGRFVSFCRDITERKQAEETIARSAQEQRILLDYIQTQVWYLTDDHTYGAVNEAHATFNGVRIEDLAFKDMYDLFPEDVVDVCRQGNVEVFATGKPVRNEEWVPHVSGERRLVSILKSPKLHADGTVEYVVCSAEDITERKRAEKALEESEERYRLLTDHSITAIALHEIVLDAARRPVDYVFLSVNPAFESQTGLKQADVLGRRATEVLPGIEKTTFIEIYGRVALFGRPVRFEQYFEPLMRHYDINAYQVGEGRFATVFSDITERKQAENMLRESEGKHRRLFETMAQGVIDHAADGAIISANPSAERISGLSFDQMQGNTPMDPHWQMIKENGTAAPGADHPAMIALRTGETVGPVIRGVFHSDKNDHVWLSITAIPLFQPGETKPFQVYATFVDITERKRGQEALRESELRFKALHNASFGGIAIHDQGVILECNQGLTEISGYGYDELIGMNGFLLIAEQSREAVINNIRSGNEKPYETFGVRKNGEEYPLRLETRNIPYKGKMVRTVEFRDITKQKRAEEEHKKLLEQFIQAQKMETVGRLAGGVAHDFNNMLGVILGYAEIALEQVSADQPMYKAVYRIQQAAQRSADLTRQLLAFARKQAIAPRVIDLNETVEGMLKMLRRLIGEDTDLIWLPGRNLHPVKMDPTQIDQILANLCVNARDAIEGVGQVTIETGVASVDEAWCAVHTGAVPGEYVLLAVSDNGCGMNREIISHLFEPFFTTKEQGKGTGLGLASVYGAVTQNNGFINVDSEPGQGTTFTIYLPRYASSPEAQPKQVPVQAAARSHETILLVEDEPTILKMTTIMLERQGYTVLAASSPEEGIRLAGEHSGRIDLLMTDVVLPGMNGRDLANNLLSRYPGIKRLFMSGYTANIIARHGVLDEGEHFIQKPFSLKDLGTKLREVMDG